MWPTTLHAYTTTTKTVIYLTAADPIAHLSGAKRVEMMVSYRREEGTCHPIVRIMTTLLTSQRIFLHSVLPEAISFSRWAMMSVGSYFLSLGVRGSLMGPRE